MSRAECTICRKPEPLCICDRVPRLRPRTGVHILQHVRERGHPLGTARLARLGLGAAVHVLFSEHEDGSSPEVALPDGAVLLYPSEDASPLSPADPPDHLVVVDGTWAQAHQLHRDNPWIQALPHVALSPAAPSRYRIRREPRSDYVSTLEAIVECLTVIEPELDGLDALLGAFDSMIDDHLAHRGRLGSTARRRKPRQGRDRRVPWGLLDHPEQVVLVHVEPGPIATPRTLMHLTAARGDGRTLDLIVEDGVHPAGLEHALLPADDDAVPVADALAALRSFTHDASEVIVWRPTQLRWLRAHGVSAQGWHTLSAIWHNNRSERMPDASGSALASVRGRAAARLGHGWAALLQLRQQATRPDR